MLNYLEKSVYFINKYKIILDNSGRYEKLPAIGHTNEFFQDQIPYFNSGLVDKNGDLWMTTYSGGVWKYDGKALLNFPIEKGCMKVYLISINEDRQGVICLGTDNNGVYRWHGEAFEPYEPWI